MAAVCGGPATTVGGGPAAVVCGGLVAAVSGSLAAAVGGGSAAVVYSLRAVVMHDVGNFPCETCMDPHTNRTSLYLQFIPCSDVVYTLHNY